MHPIQIYVNGALGSAAIIDIASPSGSLSSVYLAYLLLSVFNLLLINVGWVLLQADCIL